MIGTPEAQYITNKESGVGFLRVGMEDPVKFSTVYTGAPYIPASPADSNGDLNGNGQHKGPVRLPVIEFTAAPILDEAERR